MAKMIPRPWVLVMAAGSSRRFGGTKLLARLDGETLLKRAVRAALGCRPGGVIVVLGCGAERLRRELRGYPIRVAFNRHWRSGLASSLRAGIAALPRVAPAAIVLLADQAAIGPAELELLTAAWRREPRSIVAARSGEVIGPPALFPRRLFRELCRLRGDGGAKPLLSDPHRRLVTLDLPHAFADVDRPGDLRMKPRLLRTLAVLAAAVLAFGTAGPAAGESAPEAEAAPAPEESPAFEEQAREFERRIAALSAIDPLHPDTLEARLDFARFLQRRAAEDCGPPLDQAVRQIAPILEAESGTLLALPDSLGRALSLAVSIHNTRGQCAADEVTADAAFDAAIAAGVQAVEALRENWDYEEMAIAQYNLAYARRARGDIEGALSELEQVIAWDLEFGLHDELAGDYETLLRWQTGEEPDPAEVERFVAANGRLRARFRFAWRPYRASWTTEVERTVRKTGALTRMRGRQESEVVARPAGEDWVISTTRRGAPELVSDGPGAGRMSADLVKEMLAGMPLALPEVVLGPDGAFKEVRNLEAFQKVLGRELEQAIAKTAPADDAARNREIMDAMRSSVLSAEALAATFGGRWDFSVATWADAEYDHGDWYEATVEEPLPGFSQRPVRMTWSFKVARWLPCAEGRDARCVEILATMRPDPAHMREVTAAFVSQMVPAAERARAEEAMRGIELRLEHRYRLVTEPDTLLPWSFEERKYVYSHGIEKGRPDSEARAERTVDLIRYESGE